MNKLRAYIFVICLGLLTAATIGYAANPAVVDDQVGVYNFPWFNATTGVYGPQVHADDYYRDGDNYTAWVEAEIAAAGIGSRHTHDQDLNTTDDVNFSSVEADDYYWRSFNVTEYLMYGGLPDYRVHYIDGIYKAIPRNATSTVYSDSDLSTVVNNTAAGIGRKGFIELAIRGKHAWTDDVYLKGNNETVNSGSGPGLNLLIQGPGSDVLTLDCYEGVSGFNVTMAMGLTLRGMTIELNTSGTAAYGLYGWSKYPTSTAYQECSLVWGGIDDIVIRGGVTGGGGLHLENPEFYHLRNYYMETPINIHIIILSDANYGYSDAHISGNNMLKPSESGGIALMLDGRTEWVTLLKMYGRNWFRSEYSNTTAIWARYMEFCSFHGLHVENFATVLNLTDQCRDNVFYFDRSYTFTRAGGTYIAIGDMAGGGNWVYNNYFNDVCFFLTDGQTLLKDSLAFRNVMLYPIFNNDAGATIGYTGTNFVIWEPVEQGSGNINGLRSTNDGTATLLNGQTKVEIAHQLSNTPVNVYATPIETWGAITEWWVTWNATHVVIHADQDPTQDVDFRWKTERPPS